ncbi:MAG TPA: hypothetical protein VMY77_08075 [Chitinophagaceae bacterium]|nr:hypothetical protein [Chitinophagaceae bacterium]
MHVVTRKLGREKLWGQAHMDENIIELDPRLDRKKHLEILIHEALHLLNCEWSETRVINQSKKLANVLWKQGYRKCDL